MMRLDFRQGVRHCICATFFAAVFFLFASPSFAGPGVALVIGESAYLNPDLRLANPANDAAIMSAKLKARGFKVISAVDVSRVGLVDALLDFEKEARAYDADASHFFYYSGHGVQIGGRNFLVPTDVDATSAETLALTSLELATVLAKIAGLRARVNFVVLDACRDNPFGSDRESAPGLTGVAPLRNALVAFSTRRGMTALDGDGRNSRFTAGLALALSDETATAQDVFARARDYTLRTSGGAQSPDYIDTIALAGGDPWEGVSVGAARLGQTRGLVHVTTRVDDAFAPLCAFAADLKRRPARADDAVLAARFAAALRVALDTGADDASIKPDYMAETYPALIASILASATDWSQYDLALFLAHAAQETYQFQAVAEYGSPAFFQRYENRADLGNVQAGDGMRFRGRGLMQVRGRSRYATLGAAAGINLVANPDQLARDPAVSTKVSVLGFESITGRSSGDPRADITASTKAWTGSLDDVGLRAHYFYGILHALATPAPPQ